jgi:phage tail-like protein
MPGSNFTFISPQMVSPTMIGRTVAGSSGSNGSLGSYPVYGLTTRFRVVIDDGEVSSLGDWASCKGLKVEFKFKQVQRGGDYTSTVSLPERLEYDRITLERGIRQPYTDDVQAWLRKIKNSWLTPSFNRPDGCTATITLIDPTKPPAKLADWKLEQVYPVSWSGPSMSAGGSDAVAMETLVLQHGGFL